MSCGVDRTLRSIPLIPFSSLLFRLSLFSNHVVYAHYSTLQHYRLLTDVLYCIFAPLSNIEGRLVLYI